MSYKRIAIPRVYTDWVNWMDVTGHESVMQAVQSDLMASGVIEDAFDLNPSNICRLKTSIVPDFLIKIDTNFDEDAFMDYNYLTILGHDIHSANTKFRIITDESI